MSVERADSVVVWQGREGSSDLVALGEVLVVGEVSPAVLLPDLLEPGRQPSPLAADIDDGRGLEALAELGLRRVEDRLGQAGGPDPRQDVVLDRLGGTPPSLAAQGRAAVVAALRPALDVGLAPEPRPAGTPQESAEEIRPERLRLVAEPSPARDGRPRRG